MRPARVPSSSRFLSALLSLCIRVRGRSSSRVAHYAQTRRMLLFQSGREGRGRGEGAPRSRVRATGKKRARKQEGRGEGYRFCARMPIAGRGERSRWNLDLPGKRSSTKMWKISGPAGGDWRKSARVLTRVVESSTNEKSRMCSELKSKVHYKSRNANFCHFFNARYLQVLVFGALNDVFGFCLVLWFYQSPTLNLEIRPKLRLTWYLSRDILVLGLNPQIMR